MSWTSATDLTGICVSASGNKRPFANYMNCHDSQRRVLLIFNKGPKQPEGTQQDHGHDNNQTRERERENRAKIPFSPVEKKLRIPIHRGGEPICSGRSSGGLILVFKILTQLGIDRCKLEADLLSFIPYIVLWRCCSPAQWSLTELPGGENVSGTKNRPRTIEVWEMGKLG